MTSDNALNSQRVFKKSSPNNKLTLYLASRDLVVENGSIDRIQGVLHVEADCLENNKKLYGQVTLTFRYGREDEEVMGLKFCNEAIMSLAQVWPVHCSHEREPNTPLQDALIKRLGANAFPFHLELTPLAPPSVQLVPAKQYHGAPIGTSYDVRAYVAERPDEKVSRRNTVRMGIRVLQGPGKSVIPAVLPPNSPHHTLSALAHHNVLRLKSKTKLDADENCRPKRDEIESSEHQPPRATVEKPFLLSDGRVELEAWLDKAMYSHGEPVKVSVAVANHSSKTVRRIKTLVVQHVDVCMFSNGKFKNVVALLKGIDTPVMPGQTHTDTYTLTPHRGVTKNWIALEDSYSKSGACLASTVISNNTPEDRNVFAIYVSYYVKVKLTLSAMGGDLSVKLPFVLTHSCINEAPTDSVIEEATHKMILEGKENSEDEDSKAENENDKQNNNKDAQAQETAFGDEEGEVKSPDVHRCLADVLVNIENQLDRPKKFEGETEVRTVQPDQEELDLISKYPGSDT
ncbi:phosrestin-2-like isoform X1 [Bombyx mandarina]|uniref:Arrestin C-terminal-like domain-containing protein n=2 Tax=Bombyx TaxID=7090 RepID=A0A8R2C7D8_BOMMO|nr:phosrestin-2 isoform X1 [Bombyx mori]XP_028029687.1 phosrestin-2-like isoform X1 [Bombyx mandarina]